MKAFICLLFCIIGTFNAYSQGSKSKQYFQHTTRALTFYLAVEYNVEKILSKKTAGAQELYIAFERFKNKYARAYMNLKKSIGSSEDFNEVVKLLPLKKVDDYYEQFPISESTTRNYITRLQGYLSGASQEEAFRSLLIFQYLDKPIDEFSDGFTNLFNAANHEKSKNTKWSIRYPKSWKLAESDRPNSICKIINESDSLVGLTMMVMRVDDVVQPVSDYSSLLFAKKIIPSDANIIKFQKRNIEGCPSGSIEYLHDQSDATNKIIARVIHYYFIYNNKVYTLYAACVMDDQKRIERIWQKNLPIFESVANSIVLLDKFQQ